MFEDRGWGDWFPGEDELAWEITQAEQDQPRVPVREVLPDGLEEIPPGLFLAAILSSVDRSRLVGHDTVRLLQARSRLVSHLQAGYYTDIYEVARAVDPDTTTRDPHPLDYAAEEIGTALHLTRRSAETELGLAVDLHHLPEVHHVLDQGGIDLPRARVFTRELEALHPNLIPQILEKTLPYAGEQTTGQLLARLQQACLQLDPDTAQQRFSAGIEDRKLVITPNPDHTADLALHNIDPADALHAHRHITSLARNLKHQPGETRTLDQLRADITTDLLTGRNHHTPTTTPTPIMVILDHTGSRIPGYGPLLPTTLQTLLQTNNTKTLHNQQNSSQSCHQTSSPRPTPTQRQHVISRYPTCIFPGCRTPATQCDLDHRHPRAQGGPTTCHNLAPLCRHHHQCKTKTQWKLQRNPDNSHTWTSPLGHTYTKTRDPPH